MEADGKRQNSSAIHHVLLIDDEASVLFALKLVLQTLGFSVHDFSLPEQAINYLSEGGVCDLCICDLRMPKMNGLAVLSEVKRIRPQLNFVLMSAHAQKQEAEQAREMGSVGFLSKPFTPEQLHNIIAGLS